MRTAFKGLAVPFGAGALVADRKGRILREMFDPRSVPRMDVPIPLMQGHHRDGVPVGIIKRMAAGPLGIGIEGDLIGSDAELVAHRRRFAAGLNRSLSIGFEVPGGPEGGEWSVPQHRGGAIQVTRRNARIVEVSLCSFPVYRGARLTWMDGADDVAGDAHDDDAPDDDDGDDGHHRERRERTRGEVEAWLRKQASDRAKMEITRTIAESHHYLATRGQR